MPLQRLLFEWLSTLLGWIRLRIERRHRRLALLRLTNEQLKDIGLSRGDIDRGSDRGIENDRLDPRHHR